MSNFELSALTDSLHSINGLEHAILQSLLNWGKAQINDPLNKNQDKQGWWGSQFVNGVGCRDWTLARAKQIPDTENRVKRYTEQALQWLVDEEIVLKIDIHISVKGQRLNRVIDITLLDNTKHQVTV